MVQNIEEYGAIRPRKHWEVQENTMRSSPLGFGKAVLEIIRLSVVNVKLTVKNENKKNTIQPAWLGVVVSLAFILNLGANMKLYINFYEEKV